MINKHMQTTFLNNKYTKCYFSIVTNAVQLNRVKTGTEYYEKHHITPKSLSGVNDKSNLVFLTAREHYICHMLLTKMTTGPARRKMCYAFWGLNNQASKYQSRYSSSRLYAYSKKIMQESLSSERKGKTFTELYGEDRAAEIKANMLTRKTRGPNSPKETMAASLRMKERHKTNPWKRFTQLGGILAKITCPHCQRQFDPGNYARYHGDKCSRHITE
jgi:hypothetical protein